MRDPYKIEGPAIICFSGGRTSAYMLRKILDAHHGALPEDVFVSFQNTGKEREETLVFVDQCARRWGVNIHWLEWAGFEGKGRSKPKIREVSFETAARKGEPFGALIDALGYLPNPVARVCTANLKVKVAARFMADRGYGPGEFDAAIGIRADEPRRAARMLSPDRDNRGGVPVLPLYEEGVSRHDVAAFWDSQDFDLGLKGQGGVTLKGNCDLCFLKGGEVIMAQVREEPLRAVWWAEQERKVATTAGAGAVFRKDRPAYAAVLAFAQSMGDLFGFEDSPGIADCMCGGGE